MLGSTFPLTFEMTFTTEINIDGFTTYEEYFKYFVTIVNQAIIDDQTDQTNTVIASEEGIE